MRPPVDSGEPDRRNAERAAHRDDTRVDLAVQHHRRDFQRLRVGHAPTLDHLYAKAEALRERRRLRSAAVHEHDADADLMQDADLLHERARAFRCEERVAAGFEHEHLIFEDAQVRQRVAQRRDDDGPFVRVESRRHVFSPSSFDTARPSGRTFGCARL
jgi:hypothetical protein